MSVEEAPPPYEILEHTADIGLRARGRSLEGLFENAAWGLAEILDVGRPRQSIGTAAVDSTRPQRIMLGPADVEALLVDWTNELILFTEEGRACIVGLEVESVSERGLEARVDLVECDPFPEGTELKAATYHQLSVRPAEDGWQATVFFDV
ncbi:MAG: archease [Actinomycetota bacterium]